jgi:hypothetical protein
MIRSRRLALLLLPAALELFLAVLPGHAQQEAASSRYAFADTTLLRDTLGLKFDGLFPLVDSLQALGLTVSPDSVRALSVRYRLTLDSLVSLAQGQNIPVDSVGSYLERERRNPLSNAAKRTTTFRYSSGYSVQQTSSSWSNTGDYRLAAGSLFLQNTTTINMDRYSAGSQTSLRQTRSSGTEGGWRFSPNFSLGARANLDRFSSHDPASIDNQGERKNEFQLSIRTRQQPRRGLRSELNLFSGLLDLSNFQQVKRGTSADLNGNVRYQGRYLTHDLSGQVNGNLSRTRAPTAPASVRTNDLSNNLRGTLGLLPGLPVGLNLNYAIRRIRVETPTDSGTARQVRTFNSSADATLRVRLNNDRYVNLTGRYGAQDQEQGGTLNSRTNRHDLGLGVDGRFLLRGWNLESRFTLTRSRSEYPTRALTKGVLGGYGESLKVATIDATLSRNLGKKLVLRATGGVSLSAYRYFIIATYPNPPVDRDQYRQNYRIETQYTSSTRFNSGVSLDVSRNLLVNLRAGSTSSNNVASSYRAEWRWSYRMLPGLTASQNNAVSADYTDYDFLPQSNRLTMDYTTATSLNAVVSPRFSIDVRHNARHQPAGTYTRFADGLDYLSRSEVNDNYTLSARLSYTPSAAFSVYMQPDYMAGERDASQSGALAPARVSRQLNFSGGASVNLPLGPKGRLTGDILRTYRADRSIDYTGGTPVWQPRTESDFWNGSLQLSWEL